MTGTLAIVIVVEDAEGDAEGDAEDGAEDDAEDGAEGDPEEDAEMNAEGDAEDDAAGDAEDGAEGDAEVDAADLAERYRCETMETEVVDMLMVCGEKETTAAAAAAAAVVAKDVVVALPAHDTKMQSNSSAIVEEEKAEEDHVRRFGNTDMAQEEEAQEGSLQQQEEEEEEEEVKQEMAEEACNGEEDGDLGITDIEESRKRKYAIEEAETRQQKQQQVCKLQNKDQEGITLIDHPLPMPLPPCGDGDGDGDDDDIGDVQQPDRASVLMQNGSMTHTRSREARGSDATKLRRPDVGFTAHQLGQLYSLMHEHVQLLIQVFALSILEPARQQAAIETHCMLVDLMQSRDWMLMWRKTAFPDFCFRLPFIHPSIIDVDNDSSSILCDPNAHLQTDGPEGMSDDDDDAKKSLPFEAVTGTERVLLSPSASNAATSVFPSSSPSPSEWVPKTRGLVQTLLDVAPLHLVNEFLTDIAQVVQNHRQRHVESATYHAECEQDTLFPTVRAQADPDLLVDQALPTSSSSSSSKKQSVALVPKGISKAVRRFLPLFNKALFPNKAPPTTTANCMLFTDAEDELLAMGMIIYNTDWSAIQRHFLPSKSVHQIFIRPKNRSCARSPENPIKALVVYKYDWAKIWQFCVPHRDPAALPRQWRIALGTQKSYKSQEMMNEEKKRQVYDEAARHHHQTSSSPQEETRSSSSSMRANDFRTRGVVVECSGSDGDGIDAEEEEEAHVPHAFFAEWKPRSTLAWLAEGVPCMAEHCGTALSSGSSTVVSKTTTTTDHMKGGVPVPVLPVLLLPSPIPPARPMLPPPMYPYSPYASPIHTVPHRQAKKQLVKLALGLPSLKLPPDVRVLSQSKGGDPNAAVAARSGVGQDATGLLLQANNIPGPGIELPGSAIVLPNKASTSVLPPATCSGKVASVREEVVSSGNKRMKGGDWQLPDSDLALKRKGVENDTASINNQMTMQYNQAAASVRRQQQQQPRPSPVFSQQQIACRRHLKTLLVKPASSSSPAAVGGRRTLPFPITTTSTHRVA